MNKAPGQSIAPGAGRELASTRLPKTAAALCLGVAIIVLGGGPARANTIAFDFGSLANGAGNAQIQSFMNGRLGAGQSVNLSGAIASNSYTGNRHVTGTRTTSYTLANYPGHADGTFIANNNRILYNPYGNPTSSEIKMVFSGLTVSSISFDFEIFPDGTRPSLSNCCGSGHPNLPNLTILANGTRMAQYTALVPGGDGSEVVAGQSWSASPYAVSPAMTSGETAQQLLGFGASLTLPAGTTTLEFVDWPSMIAIDNLTIDTPDSPAPEPASLTLFGTALLGLGLFRERRKAASL